MFFVPRYSAPEFTEQLGLYGVTATFNRRASALRSYRALEVFFSETRLCFPRESLVTVGVDQPAGTDDGFTSNDHESIVIGRADCRLLPRVVTKRMENRLNSTFREFQRFAGFARPSARDCLPGINIYPPKGESVNYPRSWQTALTRIRNSIRK